MVFFSADGCPWFAATWLARSSNYSLLSESNSFIWIKGWRLLLSFPVALKLFFERPMASMLFSFLPVMCVDRLAYR